MGVTIRLLAVPQSEAEQVLAKQQAYPSDLETASADPLASVCASTSAAF
jgi:hypothetical protein